MRSASRRACKFSKSAERRSSRSESLLAAIAVHHGLVEALDAIGQEIEPRHVVFDLVDTLQIRIENENRLFELIDAARDDAGARGPRQCEMRRRHNHKECRAGDGARHGIDAGINDQAGGKGRRRNRHGNDNNDIEQSEAWGPA